MTTHSETPQAESAEAGPPGSRAPWACILAVIVIALGDLLFVATSEPMTGLGLLQPTADDATLVSKRALFGQSKDNVVLVGDSSCLNGLSPEHMGDPAGVSFVNLCTLSSATMLGFVDMAMETLESTDTRPKAIVVSVLPQSLEVTLEESVGFDTVGRYLFAYGREPGPYDLGIADIWSWYVKKHRFNVFPPQWGGSYTRFLRDLERTSGYLPSKSDRYTPPPADYIKTSFAASHLFYASMDALLTKAATAKVPVLLQLNPKAAGSVTAGYIVGIEGELTRLKSRFPNLRVVRPQHWVRATHLFSDSNHLHAEASPVYSEELGAQLIAAMRPAPGGH